jgi:alcohol dehydrogenase class IV
MPPQFRSFATVVSASLSTPIRRVPSIHIGLGSASQLGLVAADLLQQAQRVFVVTDPGVRAAGLLEGCTTNLQENNYDVQVFDNVVADPPDHLIADAVDSARSFGANCIVGLGGGSAMDTAKLVAALLGNGSTQTLEQMYGVGNVTGSRLPLIQIPTTAGTGSEVTPVSIVTAGHSKMGGTFVFPIAFSSLSLSLTFFFLSFFLSG